MTKVKAFLYGYKKVYFPSLVILLSLKGWEAAKSTRGSGIEDGMTYASFAGLKSLIAKVISSYFNFAIYFVCLCVCLCVCMFREEYAYSEKNLKSTAGSICNIIYHSSPEELHKM